MNASNIDEILQVMSEITDLVQVMGRVSDLNELRPLHDRFVEKSATLKRLKEDALRE